MKTIGLILSILIFLAIAGFWSMLSSNNDILNIIASIVIGSYLGYKAIIDAIDFYEWFKSNLK